MRKLSWTEFGFEEAVEDVSAGNPKLPQSRFQDAGRVPVVDQGKELIAGFTDEVSMTCRAQLPVIVFGDHTRCLKYIDFPFVIGADGAKVLRPKENMIEKYLYHALRTINLPDGGYARHYKFLKRSRIIAPSSTVEQRRIADILDGAEALQAKRRNALAQLDELTRSIFLDMFGDPVTNSRGWKMLSFQELLTRPLRNGRSPSNTGAFQGRVLTLSAITGNCFDQAAWKHGKFSNPASEEHKVALSDFLICRGNGNLSLVGKGYFPTAAMSDTIFPDTMIAAEVQADRLVGSYLEHIWNSVSVRQQIESFARTTNGTYKVNQAVLEGIKIPVPPLPLQQEFARRVQAIDRLKALHRQSLAEMDALFQALQHRAFRGEL